MSMKTTLAFSHAHGKDTCLNVIFIALAVGH